MIDFRKFLTLLTVIGVPFTLQSQIIFSEDFDGVGGPTAGGAGTYSFPAGWTLINNDNRTPDPQVGYVNEAWERREDFNFSVIDSCAFSTSWYVPAGAADDWMITPPISVPANGILRWNAVTYDPAYREGYEIRVGTSPTLLGMTSGTQVFSISEENTTWTSRSASLSSFAGQTVYIGFHNNSNDKFLLLIDDVVVENLLNFDVELVSNELPSEYTQQPIASGNPWTFKAQVRNNGIQLVNQVHFQITIKRNGNIVYTTSSTITPTLAPGVTTSTLEAPSYTPDSSGSYTVEYVAKMSETDDVMGNDTMTETLLVTEYEYARDNGTVIGTLGIGAGNGGYLGQEFHFAQTVSVGSVLAFFTQGYDGRKLAIALWNMNAGLPASLIASTDTLLYLGDTARSYLLNFESPLMLDSGSYVFTVIEFPMDSTIQLGQTSEIFTPGRMWVNWPTNPNGNWANVETFGSNFARAFVIRPNVCPDYHADIITLDNPTCFSNGLVTVNMTGAIEPFSYSWTGGLTNDTVALSPGIYEVVVTDGYFCQFRDTLELAEQLTLHVGGMPIVEDIYSASELITSDGLMQSPDSITFQTAGSITLQQSFQVESGAHFVAQIVPCPEPVSPKVQKMSGDESVSWEAKREAKLSSSSFRLISNSKQVITKNGTKDLMTKRRILR